jgi:ribonuclease-3
MADAPSAFAGQGDLPLRWVREVLGHEPRDPGLFRRALTHRSASGPSNERLEFLGDSVLNLLVTDCLYQRFPDADEGTLSRLRARVVSAGPLAEVGAALGVGDAMSLGGGELKTGGFRRESILADATEALIGAVYLDGGLDAARVLVRRLFAAHVAALDPDAEIKDAKTRLQELLQSRGGPLPAYLLDTVSGEPHAQTFGVRCLVEFPPRNRVVIGGQDLGGRKFEAAGQGSSRRRAEQSAAEAVLAALLPENGKP